MLENFKLCDIEYAAQELTAKQAIAIAGFGESRNEGALTALIMSAFSRTDGVGINPWLMTAAQRYAMVAIYLAMEEGKDFDTVASFPTGNGRLIDYFNIGYDINIANQKPSSFDFNGQSYKFMPLLGWHAGVVNNVVNTMVKTRELSDETPVSVLYELGCMSAQLVIDDEVNLPEYTEIARACEIVQQRIDTLLAHKESDFAMMVLMYHNAMDGMNDVMRLSFCDDGITVVGKEGDTSLSPVMFRAISCIGEISAKMGSKPEQSD